MIISQKTTRIAGICLLILGLLSAFQRRLDINLDAATLITFCLAVALFLIPKLNALQKIKVGDVEVEFKREVDELEQLLNKEEEEAKRSPPDRSKSLDISWKQYYNEYQQIYNGSSSNVEKILRASQLVEKMILEAGEIFETDVKRRSPLAVVNELNKVGLLSQEELEIYKDFSQLRNRVIHGNINDVTDSMTIRILDLLWRMVRIFG